MRRVLLVLAVAAMMVAMMAAPALAQTSPPAVEPLVPPPNCEPGQMQAFTNGLEYNKPEQQNDEQAEKHILKFADCAYGQPPSGGS